jgi:hypothetical protein
LYTRAGKRLHCFRSQFAIVDTLLWESKSYLSHGAGSAAAGFGRWQAHGCCCSQRIVIRSLAVATLLVMLVLVSFCAVYRYTLKAVISTRLWLLAAHIAAAAVSV